MENQSEVRTAFGAPKPLSPLIYRLLSPAQQFQKTEFAGGAVLLIATIIALVWSNSPWKSAYFHFWQSPLSLQLATFQLSKPLLLWVNDALMAVFFFVIGLEIKREILAGELANPRNAFLPVIAAVGGMIIPSGVYAATVQLMDGGQDALRGWGIPAATDIAFSLGALSLLGARVPASAKVFLTTFAIADDIGATLIIALFYTGAVKVGPLLWAALALCIMFVGNRLGIRATTYYAILACGVWFAFLKSGVHPTIAGFLAAFAIPSFRRIEPMKFLDDARNVLDEFEKSIISREDRYQERSSQAQQSHFASVERSARIVQTPLQRLEAALHPWVAFVVLPVFALANAGVTFPATLDSILVLMSHPVTLGVLAGLVIGKPLGIYGATVLAAKTGWFQLPQQLDRTHLLGLSFLGGIGFTMSIFIASVGFGSGHGGGQGAGHFEAATFGRGQEYSHHAGSPVESSAAKLGILFGSIIVGGIGVGVLSRNSHRTARRDAQRATKSSD